MSRRCFCLSFLDEITWVGRETLGAETGLGVIGMCLTRGLPPSVHREDPLLLRSAPSEQGHNLWSHRD